MGETATVKVSKRNQIVMPAEARRQLGIRSGDELLVDVQGHIIVLMPRPRDYTSYMAGLHGEIWRGIDAARYIHEEREEWERSSHWHACTEPST